MKRAVQFVFMLVLTLVAVSPVSLELSTGNVGLHYSTAYSAESCSVNGTVDASQKCNEGSGVRFSDHVCLGLPVLPGQATCAEKVGQGVAGVWLSNDPNRGGAIVEYLRQILKLLSEAVAAVVILMIIMAGVQYVTSTADPARVKAAKQRLQNAILALFLFLTMFAILTFLIPGGILT